MSIITCFVNIMGFLALACILAIFLDDVLIRVFPVCTGLWLLILYALAFFHILSFIDIVSLIIVALCLLIYYRRCGRTFLSKLTALLFSPSALTVYIILLMAWFAMRDVCLTNRDDLGCWAIEVNSIFHYDGFAPFRQNVAVSFGRYHPGTSLFRWWLCHLAGGYSEGMLMVASAWLFILLLSPMLSAFSFPHFLAPVMALMGAGFLLLLPGVFDDMPYQSICAEPLMSAAFAGIWIVLFSRKHGASYALLASYIFCLCFFKSTGIIFALAIIFFIFIARKSAGRIAGADSTLAALSLRSVLPASLFCALPTAIWYIYCAVMERSNYFTVSLSQGDIATNARSIYVRNLFTGIFTEPVHFTSDGILDLSVIALLLFFVLLWFAAVRLGAISSDGARVLGLYYLGMLAAFLVALLLMHCFVFQEELYFDRRSMISSCARYSEPLFLGTSLFLFYLFSCLPKRRIKLVFAGIFLSFAFLCTCFWTVYYRIVDNEASIIQAEQFRTSLGERSDPFLSLCQTREPERILFVYGPDFTLQDIEQTTLQFMAAPHSLVFYPFNDISEYEHIQSIIADVHPNSIYCTGLSSELAELLFPGSEAMQNCIIPLE